MLCCIVYIYAFNILYPRREVGFVGYLQTHAVLGEPVLSLYFGGKAICRTLLNQLERRLILRSIMSWHEAFWVPLYIYQLSALNNYCT